jgi:multidrug resistance protein MdtO
VLTALTNIGASRQKQVLRIAGAVLGGFVLGMGSQIFILPSLDTIGGFAVLMACASAIAAWVATSSPRLSYAGLQIAFAFYLINLSEFSIQTSLTVARDRAIGVLLGTSMMWLVFERFYRRPAADEMVRIFISNLRQMAELIRITNTGVDAATIVKIRRQRDQIYRQFEDVTAQSDAVPFETGPARAGHMAARDRIRRWQAGLRTFYLLEAPLIQFRIFGDPHQRERPFALLQDQFRERCAAAMDEMAESLEDQLHNRPYKRSTYTKVAELIEDAEATKRAEFSDSETRFLGMSDTLAAIVDRLQLEVATEPLYSTPS